MDAHPTTFAFVQIHHGDDYATAWGNARATFYTDFSGYPTVYFDGALKAEGAVPYSTYETYWSQRHNIPTDVTIDVGGSQVAGQPPQVWDITAHVCLEPGGTAKTMRIYIVQVLDRWPTVVSYSRNGFKQAGTTQDVTLNPGDCVNITRRFTFDNDSWNNQSNIAIIAWAQEPQNSSPPSDRAYVYQACQRRWPLFPDCNGNGVPDPNDIASGYSQDCNNNGMPDECEPGGTTDCNGNSVMDLCDIYNGTSQDCNGNHVPDECDLAGGTSQDCNNNGIPDECDIASHTSQDCNSNGIPDECDPDCNGNGVPDACDIANHTSPDCNGNGIPDECDIAAQTSADCNANGVPDECDIASHTSLDCNGNDIPDECDLANCTGQAWCDDCNNNGVIDMCDLLAAFSDQSQRLSPLGGAPQSFFIPNPPDAIGDVTLTFDAYGDINGADEHVYVTINGVSVGTIYGSPHTPPIYQCMPGQADTVIVPMATYNAAKAAGGGNVTITMTPQSGVNPTQCTSATYIQVWITYNRASDSGDQNGNGIPDECEVGPTLCPGDMNCDGAITFADIDWFVEALAGQENWTHDPCPWLNGDCTGDGDVTFADIDAFVALIGTSCP